MGCAYFEDYNFEKSVHFEIDAVRLAADYSSIKWSKLVNHFPILAKGRLKTLRADYITQFEIAMYLNFPIEFFYRKKGTTKTKGWICGEGIRSCAFCGKEAYFLCDFPIGDGRTCDLPICKDCKTHRADIGLDIDYCPHHSGI